jgi:predicted TIM-barrel fold metal-dependent hydrolase
MSVSQHLGLVASLWDLFRRDPTPQKAIFTSQPAMRLAETIAFWILPGVLARFPDLKIVLVEPSLGWIPHYLHVLDHMAEGPYDFPELDDKPSSYFHRQMYMTFVDDARGLEHRHELGVDRIMWSTDFPHPATSWPNSQIVVEKNFEGIPADERDLIVAGNASRVYRL